MGQQGAPLPEFTRPPVVELALGVQFRPVFGLRPIELASLREQWREEFPDVQEHPPLPARAEAAQGAASAVQFVFGPSMPSRLWFLTRDQSSLLQLQADRFTVNWRRTADGPDYPRYPEVRARFVERFRELGDFARTREAGSIDITQVEVTYINAIDLPKKEDGPVFSALRNIQPVVEHHLGPPIQTQATLVFTVPEPSPAPVRMYVSLGPGQRPGGDPAVLLTFTVRGAPIRPDADAALTLIDGAHEHIVRSFAELTQDAMHQRWGRER